MCRSRPIGADWCRLVPTGAGANRNRGEIARNAVVVKIANSKILTPTLVTKSKKLELNKFNKIDDNYIYSYTNWSKC